MKTGHLIPWLSLILCAALALPAAAVPNKYWLPATGDWFDPANWDYGTPNSDDWACIDNGGTATIASNAEAECASIGDSATGAVTQTGGTLNIEHLYLGVESGSDGTYLLEDGLFNGSGTVGCSGTGTFTQTGGSHFGSLLLGALPGSTGVYNLHDGELTSPGGHYLGGFEIADGGTAFFTQTGGTHAVGGASFLWGIRLGSRPSSMGTYDLLDGELLLHSYGFLEVGYWGPGSFTQTGGTLKLCDNASIYVGGIGGPESSGTFTVKTGAVIDSSNTNQDGGRYDVCSKGITKFLIASNQDFEFDTRVVDLDSASVIRLEVVDGYQVEPSVAETPYRGDLISLVQYQTLIETTANVEGLVPNPAEPGLWWEYTWGTDRLEIEATAQGGDANLDGRVSIGDVAIMAGHWNMSGTKWRESDFNGDGHVWVGDLAILAGNWGWELPGGAPVPEPAGLLLLAVGGFLKNTYTNPLF